MTAGRLLAWSIAGAGAVQLLLWKVSEARHFSFIFDFLLRVYDSHGNWLLLGIVVMAFALRHRPGGIALVRFAAQRPWSCAALAFPILCLASRFAHHAYPLSYDEASTAFQAQIFASGRLSGAWPPDLIDRLVPTFLQQRFITVSHATGEVASTYWPAYALYLTPFYWLGIPWAANPLAGALTLPAIHRIATRLAGTPEAGGWAVLLTAASPVFVVNAISFYSMPVHMLLDLYFAVLLVDPTPRRAFLAGVVGSVALTLHVPARHIVFAAPFLVWLALRPGSARNLAALAAGYLPLTLLLGFGWQIYLRDLVRGPGEGGELPGLAAARGTFIAPQGIAFQGRFASLTKIWTWGAAGLLVLAAYGYRATADRTAARLLAASLGCTFAIYFFVGSDQGHGWGNRQLHAAWFVLPAFAAVPLVARHREADALRAMAAWALALSLVAANGLRLVQVEMVVGSHLRQVPPLAQAPDPALHEIVFVDPRHGIYSHDMVRNDPFLRGERMVMMLDPRERAEALMARRFPSHVKVSEGPWGQRWVAPLR